MANKKVNNPCVGSGSPATEDTTQHWFDKRSGSTKTPCPECRNLVTISVATKKLRLHEGSYTPEAEEI